jgi:hypothetical protein
MALTLAQGHQRAQTTARRANSGAGSSGEQSREQQSRDDQIKGTGGLLTLRGSAGVAKQRRMRKDAMGQRRRGSGYVRIAPVSADRTKQRGGRAHRRVSRAADSEAKLTVAWDGARTRRWPQNR